MPPSEPGKDFTPCIVPNGTKANYKVVDGIKVFHLVAEPIEWKLANGLTAHAWGYNGTIPGPLLEVAKGDRVRIFVTNKLATPTTVHWHGVILPCGMDGIPGLTQPAIPPGETFLYEFVFPDSGTFMYHSHTDTLIQEGMGLIGMIVVHEREPDRSKRPDRDFVILLHETVVDVGTARFDPTANRTVNILTMNGKVFPATEPLVAQLDDTVWIRFGNLSAMNHHPIHLHGYAFKTIGTSGGWAPDKSLVTPEATVLVPVGTVKVIEFLANNPGDWIFHCHMSDHTYNQLSRRFPNMLGVKMQDLESKIRMLIPSYLTLGTTGLKDVTEMGIPIPPNSIPILGYDGQFGNTVLGGMANVLRVRENLEEYEKDPGPYHFPKGTVASPATKEELEHNGIEP